MKNNRVRLSIFLITVVALLLAVTPAIAANKVEFQCTPTYSHLLNIGDWTYPDGNIHIRGMVQSEHSVAPDPRCVGDNTIVINANWHADGTGPMWGTFRYETTEGGIWEGTWAGRMTDEGSWYNATGNGYGIYAGMKIFVDKVFDVTTITILER